MNSRTVAKIIVQTTGVYLRVRWDEALPMCACSRVMNLFSAWLSTLERVTADAWCVVVGVGLSVYDMAVSESALHTAPAVHAGRATAP
jgi:hypothetical protein